MTPLTFHLILHTHWDREWYLPRAGFQARLIPALGEVLDLLEHDGDARFLLDGQTVLAEDALDVRPEWIPRVAALVAAKRLEAGPWYVLADEIVPSGESLIRNLLHGTRDAESLGARMDVLYSPDAFGHPGILPTLAREFGIANAVVWRGLGRPTGADRDLYRWHGPDGAEILVYHLPAQGYEIGGDLAGPAPHLPERWRAIRRSLVDRAVTSHVAVFVGADHHAPARDPSAIRDSIAAIESGNFVRLSTLGEFFDAAHLESSGAAPITGELRWSYGHTWTLQGTHSTRARLKRRHGAVELYLQRLAEPLAALASFVADTESRGLIRSAWRSLLQSQFHDTICGCCSDDVAREQGTRLTSIAATSREVSSTALHRLSNHDPDRARDEPSRTQPLLLLWNPAARVRSGVATASVTCFRRDVLVGPPNGRVAAGGDGYRPFALVTPDGQSVPVQVLSISRENERIDAARHYPDQDEVDRVRVAFEMPAIEGLALLALRTTPGDAVPTASTLVVRRRSMANRFIEVDVATDGAIRIIDRRTGEHYHDILGFVSEPDAGDSYTPSIQAGEVRHGSRLKSCVVLATGPLVGALDLRFVIPASGGEVFARVVLMLHSDSPLLRVRLELDNRAVDHRLRIRVPVGVAGNAIAGAPFGFERREAVDPDSRHFPAEKPVLTAPAHRYVAAGAGNRGIAMILPGFFEYEWNRSHEFLVTLLRSVGELSRSSLEARPGHAGWPLAIPDAQEPGRHTIELALSPIPESVCDDPVELERMWEDVFLAPQPAFIRNFTGDSTLDGQRGMTLDGRSLVFSALKLAEAGDGVVVRCYNVGATVTSGRLTFAAPIASAAMVRGDESAIAPLETPDRHSIAFEAPARGLVSILIIPDRS